MTNALNISIVEGRVVRLPKLRQTTAGTSVCTLDIAVNEYSSYNGKKISSTTFLSTTVWGKAAQYCAQYLEVGQRVRIKGRIQQSVWSDANGMKHSKIGISAVNVDFLEKSRKSQQKPTSEIRYEKAEQTESVPF